MWEHRTLQVFLLTVLCLAPVLCAPPTKDVSLVTSTETPKETNENAVKEDVAPIVPKIYQMSVSTNVSNRFVRTLVTSRVRNLDKNAQEATFSVVLPETAYISGFIMEIDGKKYEAYVKEKEEAKKIYDQAVSSGIAAGHVAVNARDSNRFTVSINVEPQSKAIFHLYYEELLKRVNEQYEIVLNIHPGQPVANLDVEVSIKESRPLKFVKVPSLRSGNEIAKYDEKLDPKAQIDHVDSKTATVKFSPEVDRQKEFATSLGTKEDNGLAGQFIVEYDVERDPQGGEVLVEDGYFVHFFAPTDLKPLPKLAVFVLDTSGSMDGVRIKQLKEAMNSILSQLNDDDAFHIVEFGSTVYVWNVAKTEIQYEKGEDYYPDYFEHQDVPRRNKTGQILPSAFAATEENRNKAKIVVDKMAAFGGTDIKSALEVGLQLITKHKEDKNNKQQPIMIFLTDGEPTVGETSTDAITSNITKMNVDKTPIFSLSFGDGADRDFLQKISLKNQGFARHIYEAADASQQLEQFYKQISSPILKDVKFQYVNNTVGRITKTEFPILFSGSELVVAGEAGKDFQPGQVFCGTIDNQIVLKAEKIERPVSGIERLWAYLTVKQLLEARDIADDKTEVTKQALDIALKYSFVTPVSSLVVVKPNDTRSDVETEDASKADRPQFAPNYFASNANAASLGGIQPLGLSYASSLPVPASAFGQSQPSIFDRFMLEEESAPEEAGDFAVTRPAPQPAPAILNTDAPTLPSSVAPSSIPQSSVVPSSTESIEKVPSSVAPSSIPQSSVVPSSTESIEKVPSSPSSIPRSSVVPTSTESIEKVPSSPSSIPQSSIVPSSTEHIEEVPSSTALNTKGNTTQSELEKLEKSLPWLTSSLGDGSLDLILPSGSFALGVDAKIEGHPECNSTPMNGTSGHCHLLKDCPQVHSLLTDFQVFSQYFCELSGYAGVCCPQDEDEE